MFTGLVEATGKVQRLTPVATGRVLGIATPLGESLAEGDSIAVNGVCLTVTSRDAAGFEAVVSPETLRVTTLGAWSWAASSTSSDRCAPTTGWAGTSCWGTSTASGRIRALDPDGDCYLARGRDSRGARGRT